MKTKPGLTLPRMGFYPSIELKELIMRNYTFRLKPGQDLFDSISLFLQENQIQAGCILSGVGSLTHVALRFANQDSNANFEGVFEIVSLTGTVSIHGSHLHISVSGEDGKTLGGHLESGCKIHTTAEIVIAVFEDLIYKREYAEDSGYEELVVY
jgi:predicted DNA-binding protein with PD1-like motif